MKDQRIYDRYAFRLVILIVFFPYICFADTCLDWFKESKISKNDKACISKCTTLQMDMSTFTCSQECEKFCNTKCEPNLYWKSKIKVGRPEKWEYTSEKTVEWSKDEKEQVEELLSRIPNDLNKIPLEGIYRMKKSIDIVNPASTSYDGKIIILYNNTFEHPSWSMQEVLLHEIGHSVYEGYSAVGKQQYEKKLGWKKGKQGIYLKQGSFVSVRAHDNPTEDFAENFKYLLLNPEKIKGDNTQAFDWFNEKYKKQLKLKKECR